MAVIFRTVDMAKWGAGKGSNLSPTEVDLNFWDLLQRIIAMETDPPEAVSIDTIEVVGNQMTITMTDATTRGPFTLPTATWQMAGEWQPLTNYTAFQVVSNSGSLYLILHNHTSLTVFNPDEEDIDGFRYSLILGQPLKPNDLHVFLADTMIPNQLIYRYQATRRWQLPDDLLGSLFLAGTAAVASTVVTLRQNAAAIGTLTWGVGQTVPVVSFVSPITFEIGDVFTINGPAVPDTGLNNISFDFLGNRI